MHPKRFYFTRTECFIHMYKKMGILLHTTQKNFTITTLSGHLYSEMSKTAPTLPHNNCIRECSSFTSGIEVTYYLSASFCHLTQQKAAKGMTPVQNNLPITLVVLTVQVHVLMEWSKLNYITKKSSTYLYGKGLFRKPLFCVNVNNYRNLQQVLFCVYVCTVCVTQTNVFCPLSSATSTLHTALSIHRP